MKKHPISGVLAAAALLALSACAPMSKLQSQAKPLAPEQAGLQAKAQSVLPAELSSASAPWWSQFKDTQLDALIERALAESPSLTVARARIERAAAAAESAGAADKPLIGAGFDAARQRYTEHGMIPPPIAGTVRTTATVQAGISYEWDFFGRHKAELAAALGQAQAAQAEAASARLVLSAQISRSYLALARVLGQRELLGQQLSEREQALGLVRERVAAGLDNSQELRGAESPLPELRRQGLLLDEQAGLLRNQLAALSAQPASALATLSPKLPGALPLQADGALGVDLLGRRPEVVAARWRVEAATQQVTVARAQFYPNISLSAFAGFSSIGFDQLLKSGSAQYGFGPSLRLPLFDTGRLRAQLRGTVAEVDGAVAAYNGAVLDAVRDASDQLTSLQSLQRQAQEQQALLSNAQASLNLAESRFGAGLGSRLAVLSARGAVLSQQRQQLELRGQTLDSQVNLIRALGGGWLDASAAE